MDEMRKEMKELRTLLDSKLSGFRPQKISSLRAQLYWSV